MQPPSHLAQSSLLHNPDPITGYCACPNCRLGAYLNKVYSQQQLANPTIMEEMPSSQYDPSMAPPPPPPSTEPNPTVCPMFEHFGFCPYGSTCLLPHTRDKKDETTKKVTDESTDSTSMTLNNKKRFANRPQPPFVLEECIEDLIHLGLEHENDVYHCYVCGHDHIPETSTQKCGETAMYRFCPNCVTACYQPQVGNVIESILVLVGDDAHKYKDLVEAIRAELPELLKIPFFYEAHRAATTVYGWSLVSPADAKRSLETAFGLASTFSPASTPYSKVISCGSGTGYIEHLFSRVANSQCSELREKLASEYDCMNAFVGGHFDAEKDVKHIPNGKLCIGLITLPEDKVFLAETTKKIVAECQKILSGPSSFDGQIANLQNEKNIKPINFFALDEIIRPPKFSVRVGYGNPQTFLSMACKESVLLLSWPPFGSPQQEQSSMGFEALRNYYQQGGEVVIYIGDVASTGDWRFHEYLASHFEPVRPYKVRRELRRWNPQKMGLVYAGNDTIGVYKRRAVPLENPGWQWTSM